MANDSLFRIVNVYLTDRAALDFPVLHDCPSSELRQHAAEDDYQTAPDFLDEEREMRALGLPTRFSSASSKGWPRSHRIKSHLPAVPLTDDVSSNFGPESDHSLMELSLQESRLHFERGNTILLEDHDTIARREAHDCDSDSLQDHDGGDQAEEICVSNSDDLMSNTLGAVEGSSMLAEEGMALEDVTIVTQLNSMLNNGGCHVYERATDGGSLLDVNEIISCAAMSTQNSWASNSKEEISSDVGTAFFFEVDCQTNVSTDESIICCDANIMTSLRIDPEEGNLLKPLSVEMASVSVAGDPRTPIEAASVFSCGATEGSLSCGMVACESVHWLDTDLNSRQLFLKERARTSSGGGEVKVDIPSGVASAADDERTALKGSKKEVADRGSEAICDGKDSNFGANVADSEIGLRDAQMEKTGATSWSVWWDNDYGRNYFYNAETSESTWEPPKGFELYAFIPAVQENNQSHQGGLVSSTSDIEDLIAQEAEEERCLPDKSGILVHASTDIDVLGALVAPNDPISVIDNLSKATVKRVEVSVACVDSSLCQETISNAGNASVHLGDATTAKVCKSRRQAKVRASLEISAAMEDHTSKYWYQRYRLFSKYESGVKLDEEGWFSVTPEVIAKHHAARCNRGVIVDAFAGVGGNAIQFALAGHYVVAIDIDPKKIECAHHNAKVYEVADRIDFVMGDFFAVSSSIRADVVFLSPPWGGPEYQKEKVYDIQTMLQPRDGVSLFRVAQAVASNIIFYLPRNVDMGQLAQLSKLSSVPCSLEVEKNYLNGRIKAVTAYYGEFATANAR